MSDKKTIGLTPAAEKAMDALMQQGLFKDMIDAAKFAMSIAIREGAKPAAVEGASTIWNVGSFDSDGQLRQIIPVLFPECDVPYRAVESLVCIGLEHISHALDSNTFNLVEVLAEN